jgi:hypothetical protein
VNGGPHREKDDDHFFRVAIAVVFYTCGQATHSTSNKKPFARQSLKLLFSFKFYWREDFDFLFFSRVHISLSRPWKLYDRIYRVLKRIDSIRLFKFLSPPPSNPSIEYIIVIQASRQNFFLSFFDSLIDGGQS